MEGRKKSGSGIGRIFSLSLNQALSGKRSPDPCNARDRSSRISASSVSEEEKLGDGDSGQPSNRHPAALSHTRPRSAYRQNSAFSVKKKADVGSEEHSVASRDSHKKSPHSNTSFSNGKRKTDYSARKDSPHLQNSISDNTSSSSRTADSSSPCSAPNASPQLLAAEACEKKYQDTSHGSVSLQSEDASLTHSHCEELENKLPAGNSTQTNSNSVHQKRVSGNGESSGTLHKPTSGSVPKDSALESRGHSRAPSNPSGSVDSQKKSGSSSNALGSHASLLKSKSISDRQKNKPQNNRNCRSSEQQISPKTYRDTRDNQKKSVGGKTGSSDRGCFKSKSPKRRENRGPRGATSAEWESGQFSGKRRNRFQNTGYRNAHSGAHLGSDSAVSTNNRNRNYPCPPKKTPSPSDTTSKGSTERRKENLKIGSQRSEGRRVVNESVEAPQNVSDVRGIGVPNADTSYSGHREKCGRMVPRTTGRSAPALDTGHLDSSVSVSSPVADDENSGKPNGIEAQKTETVKQEDTLATQSKNQTPSQVESKKNPGVGAGSFKMNDSAEVLSNSDKSEVEVWFGVKEDTNKEDWGMGIVQLEGSPDGVSAKKIDAISAATTSANSPLGKDAPLPDTKSKAETGDSVENSKSPSPDMRSKAETSDSVEKSLPDTRSKAETSDSVENSSECDVKIGQARPQAVSIAKKRQASVATRMRGNRRLKLGISRMNVNGKDEMESPKASEGQGVNLEGTALLKFDEDLGNNVGDGVKARQKDFVETTKQQTNRKNPADHITEEKVVKECLPEDTAQSVAERNGAKKNSLCVHGHLDYASECCKKDCAFITKEVLNSVAGPKPMPETNREQEEQLANRKRGLNCEITGVSVFTQLDQDTAQLDNFKAIVHVKYSHEEMKNTALKEPVPLLSLQPRPTAHLFNSGLQPVFTSGEEQDCSSDSCLPVNRHRVPLQKSRAGFSREKERSGSIGSSSSSHPPLSSINSQSQKFSACSGTSHTSLSSDDSKDVVGQKRGLLKQRAGGRVAGLRRECFSNNGKFVRPERYNFVEKSHCPVGLGSQHADSKKTKESETFDDLSILPCSKVSMFEDQEKHNLEAAASITQLANKTVMGSQSQHCKIKTWERNETTHGFTDEFEEAGRKNLYVLSFQNDSKSSEHADGISHESSTDTVTESTQDVKLQCDGIVSSTAEKAESVNSLDSNWDSDILVINSGDSSEPVPFYDQLDADSKIILEYDIVNTVSVQLPATDFLQWSKTQRSRKHRQGLNAPEKQDRHSNVDVDTHRKLTSKKQITGNKHSLEVYDAGNGDWISGSKFSNKWNNSFVVRETGVEASEVTSMEQLARNSKPDKNSQSCELSYARMQEQEVGHMVQSTSGSECSESVSLFSDGLSAGPDLFLKERESVDHRCRNWVKKTRAWPAKTEFEGEADSQTDNSNCGPSSRFVFSEGGTGAGQKQCVWGEEVWWDSDTAQPQGTSSFVLEAASKEEGLTEGRPRSHATRRHQPKHWLSESGQYHRERVLQEAARRSWVAQDSDAAQAATSQVEKECGSSKTKSHQSHRGDFSKTKSHQSHRVDAKTKSHQSHRGDSKTKSQQSHRGDSSKTKWHPRHRGDSSKRKSHQSHREADDSKVIFRPDDREFAQAHARDDSQFLQKCVSSDTNSMCSCREHHHHSVCDVSGSKRRTSGSSECDIDVLSQSDWEDLSAGSLVKPQGAGTEAEWRRQCAGQSFQANAANNEHWHDVCPGQQYYPPYPSPSLPRSCYAPYHPETDMWVPAHHPYYSQWYNAWMAYSMGCYGYGFQDPDPGMDCKETSHGQNCCSCSSPACQQQHSQPPSQPPPPPPLSLDNPSYPFYPDPRGPYDVSSTWSQSSDSGGKRSGDRSEAPHTVSVLSCSGQDIRSTQYRQDCIKKEPADTVGRPTTSVGMPMRKEDRDSKLQGGNSPSCRNMKNESVEPETSRRPCVMNEFNHTAALGDYPVNVGGRQGGYPVNGCGRQDDYSVTNYPVDGRQFFRCHFRHTQLTTHPPGSVVPNCRGDFKPWPGFWYPPGFTIPSHLRHLDPFRFCTPPRYYPAFTPQQASASSPHGVQEERKGSPPCEKHQAASGQLPFPDMASFCMAGQFHRDVSQDWNPQTQQSAPLMSACAQPPPPPPPPLPASVPPPAAPSSDYGCPGVRETTSQTSCSVDTTGSEPCRLDSSFDTRGDYDASSSDQGEASGEGATSASSKRKRSTLGDGSFAQSERYLQMHRDSGSEDPDSCSLPSSKQSNVAKMSSDQEENNSSGSGAVAKRWGRGVLHSLHRRAIPFSSHNTSCPPPVEAMPGATSSQGPQCSKKSSPWASGLPTPPAELSYAQAVPSPGGWWDGQPDAHLYQEDYPSLSASSSSPSSQTVASLSSGAKVPSKSGAVENAPCKSFFRKHWREPPSAFRGSRWPLSGYASRLLSDNRLSGDSKGVRKAFSKAYHTKFVDTHCHLDFLFNREPYKGSFASYRENKKSTFPDNYECCVAVFCKPKSFRNESKWKPLVEEDGVWMAMGCHPKNATEYTDWTEMGLREALTHKKTVALGEIGLDYSKHYGNFSAQQKEVFIRQIGIALEMKLPLVIHCREAEDDCLEILEKHVPADYKIHCHCFTTNYASATKWLSRFSQLFIGLTPLVTYRTALDTHQVARLLPLDKLLLETDAPYFFPTGIEGEGKLSHPGMALTVAIRVAELRGIPVEDVLVQVRQNTKDMYGI